MFPNKYDFPKHSNSRSRQREILTISKYFQTMFVISYDFPGWLAGWLASLLTSWPAVQFVSHDILTQTASNQREATWISSLARSLFLANSLGFFLKSIKITALKFKTPHKMVYARPCR